MIHTDGAARGNPGPAGLGAVLRTPDGRVVAELAEFLGHRTNNHAEWRAVEVALEEALRLGARHVDLRMDSQLVARQITGHYRVKHADLIPIHARVRELLSQFEGYSVGHVPRELNKDADRMSNVAIDERRPATRRGDGPGTPAVSGAFVQDVGTEGADVAPAPPAESCVICASGTPPDVVAELPAAWVAGGTEAALPGYVCVIAKRHVREPFELPETERHAFWDAVDTAAEALATHLEPRPAKINYEIHGNTIPHLHAHIFPRTPGDRFAGRPIDGRDTRPRSDGELAAIRTALAGIPGRPPYG